MYDIDVRIFERIPNLSGSRFPSQVITLKCDGFNFASKFEVQSQLMFNFTSGACSTNDDQIMLCFPEQNKKRCYKSKTPLPKYWWQFTLTRESHFEHNSTTIAISSYNTSGMLFQL